LDFAVIWVCGGDCSVSCIHLVIFVLIG